ncbi:MAG: hypothetical protein ACYC3X_25595 [Pirellulaceae bacterium]
MKRSNITIALVAVLSVLTLVAVAAFSQMAESPQEPEPKKDHIVAPPASAEAKESSPLETIVKLSQPSDEQQRTIAEHLQSQPTPKMRAAYFRSVLNNADFRFKTWHLTIVDVKTVDSRTTATVCAIPLITTRGGTPAMVGAALYETYELSGENLNLVKTDPIVDPAAFSEIPITCM